MTAPAKVQNGRQSALPEPELVSLPDEPVSACGVVQAPWWVYWGGVLGVDGYVTFPPVPAPPRCPVVECGTCAQLGGS